MHFQFFLFFLKVDVLRNAKIKLSQELQEKKDANDTIEEELESATRKLDMNRLTIRVFIYIFTGGCTNKFINFVCLQKMFIRN